MDDMRENFSQLSEMGLPSSFLEDGLITTAKHIIERIEEKKQDPNSFHSFSHPPTTIDIAGVIHLLVQLLFNCKAGAGLLQTLPYKEASDLGGA